MAGIRIKSWNGWNKYEIVVIQIKSWYDLNDKNVTFLDEEKTVRLLCNLIMLQKLCWMCLSSIYNSIMTR